MLGGCRRWLWLLLVGIVMSGCASLLSADRQYLEIDTGEIEGASCSVVDDKARRWIVSETPGRIIIDRGATSLTIACSKPGYSTAVRQVDGSFSPLIALNAWPLFPSLLGQGGDIYTYLLQGGATLLGMGYDIAQGKHITLPQKLFIPMVPPLTAIDSGSPGPLSPSTVAPGEESQRLLEQEQEIPLSPFDELILDTGG